LAPAAQKGPQHVTTHDTADILGRATPSSLRLKTILTTFIVLVVLGLSGLIVLLVRRAAEQLAPAIRADLTWKARRGVAELASSSDLGILLADRQAIDAASKEFKRNKDVVAMVFARAGGAVVARYGRSPLPAHELFRGRANRVHETPDHLIAWAATTVEGKRIGRVALVLSKARLKAAGELYRGILVVTGLGCVGALVVSLLFVNFYLGPLVKLTERTLEDLKDLTRTLEQRVGERTADLSRTNRELEQSLEKQTELQGQLMTVSRQAGMAEVASTVLHNVGNVLNSVNVSVEVMEEWLHRSSAVTFAELMGLLRQHEHDLGHFLTEDDKGKHVPRFLQLLSDAIDKERDKLISEVRALRERTTHIKTIIRVQQQEAKVYHTGQLVEQVVLDKLIRDVVQMNSGTLSKFDITLVQEHGIARPLTIDRHKLMQVLINLLRNAIHAVRHSGKLERQISVCSRLLPAGDRVSIAVTDNGYGIAPEHIDRLFGHGFTTKADGHGFGLHSSALHAQQMGGSLAASSEGVGKGATFTLELPLVAAGDDSARDDVAAALSTS